MKALLYLQDAFIKQTYGSAPQLRRGKAPPPNANRKYTQSKGTSIVTGTQIQVTSTKNQPTMRQKTTFNL